MAASSRVALESDRRDREAQKRNIQFSRIKGVPCKCVREQKTHASMVAHTLSAYRLRLRAKNRRGSLWAQI